MRARTFVLARVRAFFFCVWNNVDTTSPFDARTAHLDFVELRAALCGVGCPFFVAEQRKGKRKSARTFPPGPPFPCHATKWNKRDHIYFCCAVPQVLPSRVAGVGSKSFGYFVGGQPPGRPAIKKKSHERATTGRLLQGRQRLFPLQTLNLLPFAKR